MSRYIALIVVVLLCVGCKAEREPKKTHLPPLQNEEQIRALVSQRLPDLQRNTGIVIGLIDGKNRLVVTQGYTDAAKTQTVTPTTAFEIGDLTKVFTGLLFADMAQRGDIGLDDPLAKFHKGGAHFLRDSDRPVTLSDLATSSAGVTWNLPRVAINHRDALPSDSPWILYGDGDDDPENTPMSKQRYFYSDLGFGLLGQALAERYQSNFQQVLTSHMLRPLQLENTHMEGNSKRGVVKAQGHDANMTPVEDHPHLSMFAGSDGLSSTAADLMTFLEATLRQKNTSFANALRKSTSVRRATWSASNLSAIGWFILQHNGQEILWRGSDMDGYSAWIGVNLAADQAVVVLANVGTSLATDIGFRILLPSIVDKASIYRPSIPHDRLEILTGAYRLSDGQVLYVDCDNDRLWLDFGKAFPMPALPTSDRRFQSYETGLTFTFDFESEGQRRPGRMVLYHWDHVEVAHRLLDWPSAQ